MMVMRLTADETAPSRQSGPPRPATTSGWLPVVSASRAETRSGSGNETLPPDQPASCDGPHTRPSTKAVVVRRRFRGGSDASVVVRVPPRRSGHLHAAQPCLAVYRCDDDFARDRSNDNFCPHARVVADLSEPAVANRP